MSHISPLMGAPLVAAALTFALAPSGAVAGPHWSASADQADDWALLAHIAPGHARVLASASGALPEVLRVVGAPTNAVYAAALTLDSGEVGRVGTFLPVEAGQVLAEPLVFEEALPGGRRAIPPELFLGAMGALLAKGSGAEAEGVAALKRCALGEGSGAEAFCLGALASLGIPLPPGAFKAQLDSGDPSLRRGALFARYGAASLPVRVFSPEEDALLLEALEDPDPAVQSLAALCIRGEGRADALPRLRAEVAFASADVPDGLFVLGVGALPLPSPQAAMTWAIGALDPSPQGAELLYLLMSGADPAVAEAALRGLERQGDPALPGALLALVHGGSDAQAASAIAGLGRLNADLGETPLIRIIQDPERPLPQRLTAIRALGQGRGANAHALLLALMEEATPALALSAALALAERGDHAAAAPLWAALRASPYGPYAEEITFALGALGPARTLDAALLTPEARALSTETRRALTAALRHHRALEAREPGAAHLSAILTAEGSGDASPEDLPWALRVIRSQGLTDLADELRRAAHPGRLSPETRGALLWTLKGLGAPLSPEEGAALAKALEGQEAPALVWPGQRVGHGAGL